MSFAEVYRSVFNRQLWEQAQRERGEPTSDEAWEGYLRFIRAIFGVDPESVND